MTSQWSTQSEPFEIGARHEDDPPTEWTVQLGSLFTDFLYQASSDLAETMTVRHLALAIVADKNISKALKKEGEKPLFDVLERKRRWALFERSAQSGGFFHTYPSTHWFELLLQEVYAEGVTGKYRILKRMWETIRTQDSHEVDGAVLEVGVRPATLYRALVALAAK